MISYTTLLRRSKDRLGINIKIPTVLPFPGRADLFIDRSGTLQFLNMCVWCLVCSIGENAQWRQPICTREVTPPSTKLCRVMILILFVRFFFVSSFFQNLLFSSNLGIVYVFFFVLSLSRFFLQVTLNLLLWSSPKKKKITIPFFPFF